MDHEMLARVYALVAQMEALKALIEQLKAEQAPAHYFTEKASELQGIAKELEVLGSLGGFKLLLLQLQEPHVIVSSLEQLKANFSTRFDCIEDFCIYNYKKVKGPQRAMLTRERNKLTDVRRYWASFINREKFTMAFYSQVLAIEGYIIKTKVKEIF